MSTTSYILDGALVLLILLQVKERRFSMRAALRPFIIVAIAVANYAHAIPTAGNDLVLIGILAAVGLTIGTASGLTTIMRRGDDGEVLTRAGWAAAFFWVLGMGARFAFLIWETHGGATSLVHFSAAHDITSGAAWADGLLAMAVLEIVGRTVTVLGRRRAMIGSGAGTSHVVVA